MTIPGVGLVIAVGLISAIGPVTRIAGPDRLVAHLGLNPGVYQSGSGKPRHARITIQERGVQLGMVFLDGTSVRALQKTAGAARRGISS